MSAFHNTLSAERLALEWHKFGVIASLVSAIVSGAGIFWHIWACKQHRDNINELEKRQ